MSAVRMLLRLLLLLPGAGVGATNRTLFFADGDTIKLSLDPPTEGIRRILWRRDPNIVADWTAGTYISYGSFKDRTAVDNKTGQLEVRKGSAADSGRYQVEVNDRLQDMEYQVMVIKRVPKPIVWLQPLGCGPSSPQCHLSCDGSTEGAEPVTYSWNPGGEGWQQSEQLLLITDGTAKVRTFSCRMENGVSHQESDPRDNPFFQEETSASSSGTAAVVSVCVILVLLIIIGSLIYHYWDKIKGVLSGRAPVSVTPPPEDGVAPDKTGPAAEDSGL